MRTSKVAGIIFTNVHDESLEQLTNHRSMASIPFGGRYRLIDFPLSNLVNAGVTNVGLVIKEKYRSLLDHVGSGIYWDLDRKNGGLHLMPPFNTRGAKRYNSYIEALHGAMDFVRRCNAEYIVTYNSDVVANVDIAGLVKCHVEKDAEISVVYTNGIRPIAHDDVVSLAFDTDGRISGYADVDESTASDYSMGICLFNKDVLCRLVEQAYLDDEIFPEEIFKKVRVYGFRHEGFASMMDSAAGYYDASMKLLDNDVRRDLFRADRPILTKTRDDMPTRYGTHSVVQNCFIADGCVIEGTVKNSVLFRGVTVEKGAVVENCILMQGAKVAADVQLDRVIADKNSSIGEGMIIKGTEKKTFLIKKNQTL